MKAVIAIDSFKGSLSSVSAASAVSEAISEVYSDAEVHVSPLADGGEGTVDALIAATGGKRIDVTVTGPLGASVTGYYGIVEKTGTAVMEMASAAGITLVTEAERNPLYTTTYGVGEMIRDAINRGCRNFIMGIGGSATNDGGVGMLSALGFEFLNSDCKPVAHGARGLADVALIKTENALPELSDCKFNIACDVKNPLCGEQGCSAVYAPQKGADAKMIADMDIWLGKYAALTKEILPNADENYPGAGAAGGLGFAFLAYLGGRLCSGIELVMAETGLEALVKDADVVVTGEGRLDGQSYMGKAPVGVARLAKKYEKTVIAFCGCATEDAAVCNEYGIDAFFPILRTPCTVSEAMECDTAYANLKNTAIQVFRLIKTADKH